MHTIKVDNLSKTYQVHKKEPGIKGSIKGLFSRKYEDVKAVKQISFLIDEGELVGFIGPNGAGKTTTMKMLSGILYPTSGSIEVIGHDPWKREYGFLRQISLIMGQRNQLWWDLPPAESFSLFKEIYDIPDTKYKKNLSKLVDMLDLGSVLDTQVRKLSLGQRMKAELVASLLHQPKVLFMDEPTIGLDVVMQKKLREFIKEYNKEFNSSILLTSHYMGDVKELCKRIIIIDKGLIVYDGLLQDIVIKFAKHKNIEIIFQENIPKKNLTKYGQIKTYNNERVIISVARKKIPQVSADILKKFPVIDINIKEVEIEDVIRSIFVKER